MDEATQDRVEALNALLQDAPVSSEHIEVRPFGDDKDQDVRFFLYQDVLQELAIAGQYRPLDPWFAVLLGHFAMDDKGAFLEVTGFTGLQYLDEDEDLYPVMKPVAERAMRDLVRGVRDAGRHMVGCVVSAPGTGAALDPEIARVHLSLFNMPFQIAVVIDPGEMQLGVYARPPRGKFFSAAFSVVNAREVEEGVSEEPIAEDRAIEAVVG